MSDLPHSAALQAFRDCVHAPELWPKALALTAEATGSRIAELMGWISPSRPPLHLLTDGVRMPLDQWDALGGADPGINPMINAGLRSPAMSTIVDTDLISLDARKKNPLWTGFFDPCDIPHLAAVVLRKDAGVHLTIGLMRSREQGPFEGESLRIFEACARAAADAARLTQLLGHKASVLLMDGLDAVGVAAIGLNAFGRIVGVTPAALALVANGDCFNLSGSRFSCYVDQEDKRLQAGIGAVLHGTKPARLMTRGRRESAFHIEVLPLSGAHTGLGFEARALVVLTDASHEISLTAAEVEVLRLLQSGLKPQAIAEKRQVSIATVRSQVQSIDGKIGAERRRPIPERPTIRPGP